VLEREKERSRVRQWVLKTLLVVVMGAPTPVWAAVTLSLATDPGGGLNILGARPTYSSGFGSVNGLGVGTPAAGITIITTGVSGGVLYTGAYDIVISGMLATHRATVDAYVSTNFAHPTILKLESCQVGGACTTAAGFTILSTSAAARTPVIPSPGVANGTYKATLGLFVSNTNGAGTFSGADSATITFRATDTTSGGTSTVTLRLNNPSENMQTAVQLLLAQASGGLAISPASDFAADFGNVNGLGVGSAVGGLTIVSATGGVIYSTPYLLQPSFADFASTTGTLTVYVSTDFAHPSTLQMRDSTAAGGPYNAISKLSGSPTTLTTAAASGASLTRYLGMFVSNANGVGAFPGTAGGSGADSVTLTYTLTVP
jgi:hypothetical protein